MKNYELTCLISPDFPEIELQSFQEKIIAFLQQKQAVLLNEVHLKPAKIKLAYPIKKVNQAYLINFNFKINPDELENLEKELKEEPSLLRYTILLKKISKKIRKPERVPRTAKKPSQPKVELKEIEKKLEEILGE